MEGAASHVFPATATGLVIHRDVSSWERGERKGKAGVEGRRLFPQVPALRSTFRAVGCQATMPTLLEWPSSTTTGSVRDRVSPFSGICHTWRGQGSTGKAAEPRAAPPRRAWLGCCPCPAAAGAVTALDKQEGNWAGNRSLLPINPWLIRVERPAFTRVPAQTHSS